MKVNFNATFAGLPENEVQSVKLATVAIRALNSGPVDPRETISLEEMCRRGNLALKIIDGKATDISVDDAALIRRLLPLSGFTPLVVAQAARMLEGTEEK